MYQPTPRHPLRSFKFWFLVLGCAAATTAWQMGWLPDRHDHREHAPPVTAVPGRTFDVRLSQPTQTPPLAHKSDALSALTQEAPAVSQQQREPAVNSAPADAGLPPAANLPQWHTAEGGAAHRPTGAAANAPEAAPRSSPFGPANPEFIPAGAPPGGERTAASPGTQRFPADPGMIQQVSAVEAGPGVRAAALLQANPPIDFPQPAQSQIDWNAIDRLIHSGQEVEAHRLMSSLYWEQPDQRDRLVARIQQTAQRIYFQPRPHYVDPHIVQAGDLLQGIAQSNRVSWQYLAKLNRVDPQRIRPGQDLKVIRGPFGAVVDLRRFELTVHAHGYYVARFPIGIGKDGSTPVGEFTVQDKLEDPTYYGPDGVISSDDPRNPLGEFWLSLGDGYGIHGTIDDTSIGRAESRGCIRLRNQDIADLYDLLIVGSPVVIRR